jgi:hypothetical protein
MRINTNLKAMGNNEISNNKTGKVKKSIEEGPIFDKRWFMGVISFPSFINVLLFLLAFSVRDYTGSILGGVSDTISIILFIFYLVVFIVTFLYVYRNKRVMPLKSSVIAMVTRACVASLIIFPYIFINGILEYF